ncbi:general secretion pathway protein GspE [Allorhodopirellula heiligendammensis]|uniref:Bacteriophage N4 adsorption protein B n=1 Tax=Allorhodopirellula heiligendammensis TaxID=2714739 RepID=A0A5C6C3H2_9BACT|nr:general secretion pathway protein GspE [Allorhodopirellula heiligendammensis]TWU18632.1 bacteriophage N4 adsorption protein B [Allorhodopirellula heiligendammensis]
MRSPRIFTVNRSLAKQLDRGVHVGCQFAFVDLNAIDQDKVEFASDLHPAFSGVGASVDKGQTRLTIPIPHGEKLSLPGVNVKASSPPSLKLASLTCDRDLYRFGSDQVNILVVDLDSPEREVCVDLLLGTSIASPTQFDQRHVQLNESGLGIVRFDDLPVGTYQIVRSDSPYAIDGCEFSVAGFELAPLVATIGKMQVRVNALSCTLQISHFSKPLTGAIRVDLYDNKSRIDSRRASVKQGLAIIGLEIDGDGPHHLEITMVKDSSATATIPLPGSERQQRGETVLTRSGLWTTASLMPGQGTTEALGLHVRQTEQDNSPVQITDTLRGVVRIGAMQAIEDCVVCTCPFLSPGLSLGEASNSPSPNTRFQRLGNLSAGEVIEVPSSELAGLISVGCFVDEKPYEAHAVTLHRCDWRPSVQIAPMDDSINKTELGDEFDRGALFEPESKVSMTIDLGIEASGYAAVVIRDARLQPSSRPKQRLAANIKLAAEEAQPGAVETQTVYGVGQQYESYPYWAHVSAKTPAIDNETLAKFIDRDLISESQADHVMESASECGKPYFTLLEEFGYADSEDISLALAEIYGYQFVDLDSLSINEFVIELCPESVARENTVIPIREEHGGNLVFAMSNPVDLETIEKLRFILNRRIEIVIGTPDAIVEAINHFYGQVEGEYADSMLQEFTDTAIDFTETVESELGRVWPSPPERPNDEIEEPSLTLSDEEDAHVIFCKLIECTAGRGQVVVDLPDRTGRYTIDAFIVSGRQWSHVENEFDVHCDPYVKLQVPAVLLDGDQASGRVIARCQSGSFALAVQCDGVPVELRNPVAPYDPVTTDHLTTTESEFTFVAGLGRYTAKVCDRVSGKTREDNHQVNPLGKLVEPRRTMRMISDGQRIELNDQIRRIRLLPSVQPMKQMVAEATANYDHLCCEQTAAKLFSAVICLANQIGSGEPIERSCTAIRVGLKRQQDMWLPGKGFAIYPGNSPDVTWGRMATMHLLKMDFVSEMIESSSVARGLLGEVRQLARESAKHYRIAWPPESIGSSEDAYAQLRFANGNQCHRDQGQALEYARLQARKPIAGVRSFWRADQAMAAAALLRGGSEQNGSRASDTAEAMRLANRLFYELGPEGRLYSTIDSVALVVLLLELSRSEWMQSDSTITVNDQTRTIADALDSPDPINSLQISRGTLAVEYLSYAKQDWMQFVSNTPITVALMVGGHAATQFQEGDAIELRVRIKQGYEAGDLIWVALPPCLSRIQGGGQVKQFAVDMEGESETVIRLAATAPSSHPSLPPTSQRFLVCLRNMYDEDRIGNPGPISVQVTG